MGINQAFSFSGQQTVIPLNSAWESSHSQKHPWLFDLSPVGDSGTGALGTELFKSTEMVSSVNVNFCCTSLVSKIKTSWQ